MKFVDFRFFAVLIVILTHGIPSWAQANTDDRPLVYSGFAFSGNAANRDLLYPYTAALTVKNPGFIDELLTAKLKTRPDLLKRVSLGKATGKEDVTSVACALVQENIETQRIDGRFVVIVLLQANVLGFNRASNSVVASYPLRMRFTRTKDSEPSKEELQAFIKEAYTSANPVENILDQWLNRLEKARFKYGGVKYLRVSDVSVAPEAESVLQQSGINVAAFKYKTANLLEGELADKANVPIVPNTVGEIGHKMALRFADAQSITLELPEPDYAVNFLVRGFASASSESIGTITDIYRSKATLSIQLPETGKFYIDEQVYDTRFVTRPKDSKMQFDKWEQYNKSLQVLIGALSKQVVNPEDEWLKEHASRKADAKPAFLQVKQLFQEL